MKEYYKLSEYIEYLKHQLEKYGDGEVYAIGKFGDHEMPPSCKCEWDEEYVYDYDKKKNTVNEGVVKTNIHYILY